ncbi:MAG: DEAD/DEAH box helicase family protein [Flavobacteriaceae bacterium]|nr:DEAD/DEAH box helicase family protein [Flavobacteriaceae bacterium]
MNKNITNKGKNTIYKYLDTTIKKKDKISVISAITSIFALYEMYDVIQKSGGLDNILTMPFSLIKQELFNDETSYIYKNRLQVQSISKKAARLIQEKMAFRANYNTPLSIPNAIIIDSNGESIALNTNTFKFNIEDLGLIPSEKSFLNTLIDDDDTINYLKNTFKQVWKNPKQVDDIKQDILSQIDLGSKDHSPEYIYFFTLYNIFKEYLDDFDEDKIIKPRTGFKETLVWNKLYKFQKDGVIGAIDKMEKYNGCIIADSVGLGKTFEALAVIKYYELRNQKVLVLCPKKLRDNWTVYTQNDRRNILSDDRFAFDVLNHTDLSRDKGKSGDIDLATVNWERYDLIVIDESHNFRNNNASKTRKTRYSKLLNDVIKKGVRTKILMLSATPVNNRLNDLKNQVAFITEGNDTAFENQGIPSIANVMKNAQGQFNSWLKTKDDASDSRDLIDILDNRYFKLLDLLTIARSRKHIEKYYDLEEIGEFPVRKKPINIKSDIDILNKFPELKSINTTINHLNLSAYSPLDFILPEKKEEYSNKYDTYLQDSNAVFTQVDREKSLIHLMRVNLLKRMESSINSFSLTVEKLHGKIGNLLEKIQHKSEYYSDELSISEIEIDDPTLADYLIGNKTKVLIQDMDLIKWKEYLLEDQTRLEKLWIESREIDQQRDKKLNTLYEIIKEKVRNPLNENNKKIIVFTAFADTAEYLYNFISEKAETELKVYTALITGSGKNKTTMPGVSRDLNEMLTHFSPVSKKRDKIYPSEKNEIDILIATDCISEGQNLQDCDYLINYDIHWNPVRIIQRFGRIDRLGSTNESIQLTNFWPNLELDEYINLEARVSGRMHLLDVSATGEENIIEYKPEMNDLDYRKKQLEQMQDEVVDLEDIKGGLSITDFTYNDFRMDLMGFLKTNKELLNDTPRGIHAIAGVDKSEDEGVIFCLKQRKFTNKHENLNNALSPYFTAFIAKNGAVKLGYSKNKQVLDEFQRFCSGNTVPNLDLIVQFNTETNQNQQMDSYTLLLEKMIENIVGKEEETGMSSLFSTGKLNLLSDQLHGLNDFELVSFLILKQQS